MELSADRRKVLSGEARGLAPTCIRFTLYALSLPYRLVVRVRNALYNSGIIAERRVDKPVISVGNITAGGTGKTPAVEFVVRWFLARGARPAILSRGYGAKEDAKEGGNDEALVLAAHLPDVPHRQSPRRYRAALAAMREDRADVLVLDDGFQHRRLARFGDIVLIDASNPFGYGHLLPRGLLREPASSLRRADAVVVTRCDLVAPRELDALVGRLRGVAPGVPLATAAHVVTGVTLFPDGVVQAASVLSGRRVALFSSVGNPAAFRLTVERLGARVESAAEFPDHHWYSADDLAALVAGVERPVELFVTTEKDAVKLAGLWPRERRLMVLGVEFRLLSGESELFRLFEEALVASKYEEVPAAEEKRP